MREEIKKMKEEIEKKMRQVGFNPLDELGLPDKELDFLRSCNIVLARKVDGETVEIFKYG